MADRDFWPFGRLVITVAVLAAGAYCFLGWRPDPRAIQEMLGHRRITTTERYTHVEPEHLRRVWDRAHPRQ